MLTWRSARFLLTFWNPTLMECVFPSLRSVFVLNYNQTEVAAQRLSVIESLTPKWHLTSSLTDWWTVGGGIVHLWWPVKCLNYKTTNMSLNSAETTSDDKATHWHTTTHTSVGTGWELKPKKKPSHTGKQIFLKTVAISWLHFNGYRPHLFYMFVSVRLVCVYLRRSESETSSQHLLVIHLSGHIVRSVGKWFWCKHIKTWVFAGVNMQLLPFKHHRAESWALWNTWKFLLDLRNLNGT